MTQPYRKKLIEVALPLEAINVASAREKSIRHGHPSTLHLWWARRPLAAARAVIFAQMVDDPSGYVQELNSPGTESRKAAERELKKRLAAWESRPSQEEATIKPTLDDVAADLERQRLFKIIEELVKWESTTNEDVLQKARDEIWASWRRTCAENAGHPQAKELFDRQKLPGFHDPFAGGGALPLEAQRLGLEAYASDLNPVAVLINKAMIEIPPKFAGQPPVNPEWQARSAEQKETMEWPGASGLAEDVRYYGQWMRDEAEKRIGHLYPKVAITPEMVAQRPDLKQYEGQELTVIAWIWARTVKSPNPAFRDVDVPLASTFYLCTKPGKEAYVEPVIENGGYRFEVRVGKPVDPERTKMGTTLGKRAAFFCVKSEAPISYDYVRSQGKLAGLGSRLMAVVAEGRNGRVYLSPTEAQEKALSLSGTSWKPDVALVGKTRVNVSNYGIEVFGDLFTQRQLVALTTFSDLVQEARQKVINDSLGARASRPPSEIEAPEAETSSRRDACSPEGRTPGAQGSKSELGGEYRWHSRGYLPHFEAGETPQHIVFRLADSLPRQLLEEWEREMKDLEPTKQAAERRRRIEAALDQGRGSCFLKDERIASLVQEALLQFDGDRYRLHAWVIMPNHVHVLMTPLGTSTLSSILHSWKSFTAKEANRILGREGEFWQAEYYDRYARNEEHFETMRGYIHANPVKAGLCAEIDLWPYSSAARYLASRGDNPPRMASRGGIGAEQAEGNAFYGGNETEQAGRLRSPEAYADAVATYLGFGSSRSADAWSTVVTWRNQAEASRSTFARQAIPMTWDYTEVNPFSSSCGNWTGNSMQWVTESLNCLPYSSANSLATCADAATQNITFNKVVSTDPPYYDNIGYADLSDFFYVWLRRSLRDVYPDLFATIAVPKAEELVATPYRHGTKAKAETFFLDGMTQAMHQVSIQSHPAFPVTIYYAFKQSETTSDGGESSTGWETFLQAVIRAGFSLTGTWPMRTEREGRTIDIGANSLASSIVLVCRRREATAPTATRREFLTALQKELAGAVADLQRGNIAPVDLQQASIGPGMAIFTRYSQVLDAEGEPLTVRDALKMINQALDEALAEQEGDFDADTRWALTWFEQFGFAEGEYGVAETLSKAKNTSVGGIVAAEIARSEKGKVRLLRPEELPPEWDPAKDERLTVWETVHHLIRALEAGDASAAELLVKLGDKAEIARELAYRLYSICDRTKRSQDAQRYNALVQNWQGIVTVAAKLPKTAAEAQLGFEGMN